MLDVFGFPTPQGANYQEFYGGGTVCDWIKPRGASMVRIMLIGAGGGGSTTALGQGGGGGAGGITSWIGPAIFIPDILRIQIGVGGVGGVGGADGSNGTLTQITYQAKNTGGYVLLRANGGQAASATTGGTGAAGNTNNGNFYSAGIFSSIGGQNGSNIDVNITASSTSFLSGGAGGAGNVGNPGGSVTPNYNYPVLAGGTANTGGNGRNGYFITQPILLGAGGSGGGGNSTATGGNGGNGGIGCGGGGGGRSSSGTPIGGNGGDGAAFIWSW